MKGAAGMYIYVNEGPALLLCRLGRGQHWSGPSGLIGHNISFSCFLETAVRYIIVVLVGRVEAFYI